MKKITKFYLIAVVFAFGIVGCSRKFNQTGTWLVSYDSTLTPRYLDSIKDSLKLKSSQVNAGLANGNNTILCVGKVPATEADLLLEFSGLDSVYYASKIISAQVILRRSTYVLMPYGLPAYHVNNLQVEGYAMDTSWSTTTFTWDSVALLPRESSNIILSPTIPEVTDTTLIFQLDTSVVRRWAEATQDTNFKNYGFIVKPMNMSGVLSVYSTLYSGTGYEPTIEVICAIDGNPTDTVISTSSYSTYVATTSIVAPSQSFAVQSGTGLHGSVVFDLSKIPNFSIVNYAELTLFANPDVAYYSGESPDSLTAYYQTDPTSHALSSSGIGYSTLVGNKYTFPATILVQQMLNRGNYGFVIARYDDNNNLDTRFIYDENAPDSLKPRLTITYAPAVTKR